MAIALDAVTLVSIFVESVLYGFFVFLFAVSVVIILRRRAGRRKLLSVSVVMFILATVHVASDLKRMLDAFLAHANTQGGPAGFLRQVNTPLYEVKSTAYAMQTLVGDGFMLYRLYLVWNGNKLVMLPVTLTFIASIGVGIGALQGFARVSSDTPVFITELHDWIISFFSLTLFTNFVSTGLISARIWWVHSRVSGLSSKGGLGPAAVVIVESGAIYSACLIILLSLYLSGNYAQYIVLDAVSHVVGIVFSFIIVRVALGVSSDITTVQKSATPLKRSGGGGSVFQASDRQTDSFFPNQTKVDNGYGMDVKVTKTVNNDSGMAIRPIELGSYGRFYGEA